MGGEVIKEGGTVVFARKGVFFIVVFLVFSAVFALGFIMTKENSITEYGTGNSQILSIFSSYGMAFGVILGILTLIGLIIARGIASLLALTRFHAANQIISILAHCGWLAFAVQLVYFEGRFTSIGSAIILFIGYPLFYASIAAIFFSALFIFIGGKQNA
ncbi:hypothetical protein J4457_05890 [Candidatus Woesearchaeota archaeon]|nr:hypothetical protein [Candidatus Woesearchaeota archaeon]